MLGVLTGKVMMEQLIHQNNSGSGPFFSHRSPVSATRAVGDLQPLQGLRQTTQKSLPVLCETAPIMYTI